MATMNKLRTQMAQQFLDALNQSRLPWKACWQQALPQNAITGKPYHGVNAMNLSFMADAKGYKDPRWCTYKQAQEKGWQVRKGEHSSLVEYWAYYDKKQKKMLSWADARKLLKADPEYIKNLQLSSRCYHVFNGEQIDGIPEMIHNGTDIGKLREQRDTLIRNMAVGFREEGSRAFYSPGTDTITLPLEATFDDEYGYMATFLHEAAHATGHACRLNRDLSGSWGGSEYAKEELRAEISSAFAAQALGLQLTDEQFEYHMKLHSAYLQSWAAGLKEAPEELFRAIRDAEEISDYLIELGDFFLEEETEELPFFGKIVYVSDASELPSYYDNYEKYLQELTFQQSHGSSNYGVELTHDEFLEDVSKALLTQGHYIAIGATLDGDYTAEIRAYMAANPPDVEVHPWMAMENLKVESVHRWESQQLSLMPDELSVVADGHTGQLFVQPGKHPLMEQRYLTYCCSDAQPEPSISKKSKSSTSLPSYREQVQAIFEYEVSHGVPENDRLTKWFEEGNVSVAKPWYREIGSHRTPISENLIAARYSEIGQEHPDPMTITDEQREQIAADENEREFWKMKEFLDRGGDIAELADSYELDLDYGP